MRGLDGLDRLDGRETTSRDWTDQTDGSLHVAKMRVAGSNPVIRSHFAGASHEKFGLDESFVTCLDIRRR